MTELIWEFYIESGHLIGIPRNFIHSTLYVDAMVIHDDLVDTGLKNRTDYKLLLDGSTHNMGWHVRFQSEEAYTIAKLALK